LSERKAEVRQAVSSLSAGLASGRIKPVISKQGAIAFTGWENGDRNGVTDVCAFRSLMLFGSSMAKVAIARAEQMAGRTVDRQVLAQGHHGHADSNGTVTWHDHKG
jgi:hypothetical protein